MNDNKEFIHVAVGVVFDQSGRILIARRPDHLHQGGLWEFPGGKVDKGETVEEALFRELLEEVGIKIGKTDNLIQIEHDYGDKQVILDVLKVTDFSGEAHGRENQAVKWVDLAELCNYDFPAANRGIINAIRLPPYYMITGEYLELSAYITAIDKAVRKGVSLIQFRAKHLEPNTYVDFANKLLERYQESKTNIILNSTLDIFQNTKAAGLHLSSKALYDFESRPIDYKKLLSASVHNQHELEKALRLEADFIVVSPVKKTTSHPEAVPIGWERLGALVKCANCPVYALGGLALNDIEKSIAFGAKGIAGISMFEH